MRPELLNRIDETVVFHQLAREDMGRIVEIQLGRLRERLAERKIELELTQAAQEALAGEGFDPAFGAHPLKRVIQQRVENPLATLLLEEQFGPGDRIVVGYESGGFSFESAQA